jgi:hypothetical protein
MFNHFRFLRVLAPIKVPRRLLADRSGAVMVESLVAIPTLLAFMSAMMQLCLLSMASLVVQHAAVVAARSASVIIPDMPLAFESQSPVGTASGDRLTAVESAANAVILALQPPQGFNTSANFNKNVTVVLSKGGDPPDTPATTFAMTDMIQAKVTYSFNCQIGFGASLMVCGTSGHITLQAVASMPNQGAEYGYY